jgi:hydrogenase maturation protein HypF
MATPAASFVTRKHVQVRGVVQGVGFRPFVYNLAVSLKLVGYVFNSSGGVTIELEGSREAIQQFLEILRSDPPPLAEITEITITDAKVRGEAAFSILHSRQEPGDFGLVSPDVGTCANCWRDFGDPANRRFGYPFTNCTHCGPRYTIIEDLPYDRASTTMSHFTMCSACRKEYEDPTDRRFHAQPNACAGCGPSLCLVPRAAALSECVFDAKELLPIIRKARALLHQGKILAVKGLGGFLLACDATNTTAVAELRRRKHRPHKPFALMTRDVEAVREFCDVSLIDESALQHLRRPIVILPRRVDRALCESVAPGNNTIGVMLPYTPLHYLLFSDCSNADAEFAALVMTSGNLSEEPIVTSNDEALARLDGVADWFLLHNRDIATRVDDSVVRTVAGCERVLRRSRGFVPQAIDLEVTLEEILAVGGELKNTFCLTKDRFAILSQHIGDLENYETMRFFDETLAKMKRLFKVEPRAIAHDLHPNYMSTRMALASPIQRKIGVQHHHAHIASCMAENHLHGQVIGVAFDGTGYGTDGRIWGGEFLVAGYAAFTRAGHLSNVLLPGGDAAVRQPWRMALSYLRDAFGDEWPCELPCFRSIPAHQIAIVDSMLSRRFNTVETSSCGRLFDAVAALLELAAEVTFEGEAAIALEAAATPSDGRYDFHITDSEPFIVEFRPMIAAIVDDIRHHTWPGEISSRFHNTVSASIVEGCTRIRAAHGLDRICLSGGTFQNAYLLERTVQDLRRREFGVFLHSVVPANDGGIALGQAVIANALLHRSG